MRIIDADALDRAFTDLRFDGNGDLAHWGDRPDWCMHGDEVEKLIAAAPTIDAIPVEWLRGKMVEADEYCDNGLCSDISWLIKTWQKEQEANHDRDS